MNSNKINFVEILWKYMGLIGISGVFLGTLSASGYCFINHWVGMGFTLFIIGFLFLGLVALLKYIGDET